MSAQPAVLQVVILRDGLLVGTEVFVPGQYTLGAGLAQDLRLDDPSVHESHAVLYFQNGRAAVQDAGSNALFVNGHRVNACEVRAVDEIAVGPFTLKVRVMAQQQAPRPTPSAEVAAILGSGPLPIAPRASAPPPPPPPPAAPPQPATVVSNRRLGSAPSPEPAAPPRATYLRPVRDDDSTESVQVDDRYYDPQPPAAPPPAASTLADFFGPEPKAPVGRAPIPSPIPSVAPLSAREAAAAVARAQPAPPPPAARAPVPPVETRRAPETRVTHPAPPPAAPPQARAQPQPPAPVPSPAPQAAPAPAARKPGKAPVIRVPSAAEAKGKARLFVELYWGDTRHVAASFSAIDKKKGLVAGGGDDSPLPLYGFELPEGFVFAEQSDEVFKVYVPPRAGVERRAQDGRFYGVKTETLDAGPDQRRSVTLAAGHALRFLGPGEVSVLAYVQPALPKPFVNPLARAPWLLWATTALFGGAFIWFGLTYGTPGENPDFQARNLSPVAVKLIAPPKPEEKKKLAEKVEKLKKPEKKVEKKEEPKVEKPMPKAVAQETKKALKSVEKLAAAGPAMKDLLAAVDKLGNGPGVKGLKNDFKLSGLIGKQPIAAAGIGSFGLGGGGAGGAGIKGLEVLHGKGGGGIGALGAGNIGKGSVAGTVTHAVSRNIGAQGSIDKEAVAKVINAHLNEVSSCYERALLKTPGLAGKIVLEWQITLSGAVGSARTKSSTMQSPAVEACILNVLKLWQFPPAKGAGVLITYPFMFNSVGY